MLEPDRSTVRRPRPSLAVFALALCTACGDGDPTGSGGEGSIAFTTWGEEFLEVGIPADPEEGGFVDGWQVVFSKFLVTFHDLRVRDQAGREAGRMPGSVLFDNTVPGVKPVVTFERVPAKAWTDVSFAIAPSTAETELGQGVTEDDLLLMLDGGYSLYAAGIAEKDGVEKSFAWGFDLGTRYRDCHSEQGGRDELGVVVTNNATVEAQLTTHADHLFYDRLRSSEGQVTSVRFDALAAADVNDDGQVTLEELDQKVLDVVSGYDRSGLDASTHGAFIRELTRTVGHFRGEGECFVSKL
jgi:hypothetical protein